MEIAGYRSLSRWTFWISFAVGTLIFGAFFYTGNTNLLFMGYGYTILVGLVNIGVLIALVSEGLTNQHHRSDLFRYAGVLLINIPIMLVYAFISMLLLNTMRIEIVNDTSEVVKDIYLPGCNSSHIEALGPHETETVWVGICGDGKLEISYLLNGEREYNVLIDYITQNMGQKVRYTIGQKEQVIM